MPNFQLAQQPRFPLRNIDSDIPITFEQLLTSIGNEQGITLCVRSCTGAQERGGYFFCIRYDRETQAFHLETMEQVAVADFNDNRIIRFINHVAGLQFDGEMLDLCQNTINFRND